MVEDKDVTLTEMQKTANEVAIYIYVAIYIPFLFPYNLLGWN